MRARKMGSSDDLGHPAARLGATAGVIAVFVAAPAGMLLSPLVLPALGRWAGGGGGDAYAPASALLATLALGVVTVSLMLQRSHNRHERERAQRELAFTVVKVAMDDPVYAQCWGPRVTPPDMDERLFFYVNQIISLWTYSWDCRDLSEVQVRMYAKSLFESEVAREFWARFGMWRRPSRRRAKRFVQILQEEYHLAVSAGPPARPYEPPTDNVPKPLPEFDGEILWRASFPWRRDRNR